VSYFDNSHKMHVGAKKYLILLFDLPNIWEYWQSLVTYLC